MSNILRYLPIVCLFVSPVQGMMRSSAHDGQKHKKLALPIKIKLFISEQVQPKLGPVFLPCDQKHIQKKTHVSCENDGPMVPLVSDEFLLRKSAHNFFKYKQKESRSQFIEALGLKDEQQKKTFEKMYVQAAEHNVFDVCVGNCDDEIKKRRNDIDFLYWKEVLKKQCPDQSDKELEQGTLATIKVLQELACQRK